MEAEVEKEKAKALDAFREGKVHVLEKFVAELKGTSLELNGKGLGDSGAAAVSKGLQVNSTLTHLNISGNQIGRQGAQAMADAIKVNSTLAQLVIGHNDIGPQGAQAIADGIKVNSTLTHLDVQYNGIGPQGAQAMADAIKVNSTLAHLNIFYNNIGPQGAQAMADAIKENKRCKLEKLGMAYNQIGDEGARHIAKALEVNSTITHMVISFCNIGPQGAQAMADAIKVISTLVHLDIGYNDIGPQGAQAMADAIKVNNTLTELNLSHNNVGQAGAKVMLEALQVNQSIERIWIQDTDWIPVASFRDGKTTKVDLSKKHYNAEDAIVIASLLMVNSTLTHLDISGNQIGPRGAQAMAGAIKVNSTLVHLEMRSNQIGPQGAQAMADAIKENKQCKLEKLDISSNKTGDDGAKHIAKALEVNSTLAQLVIGYNDIGPQGAHSMADAIKVNSTLVYLDIGYNDIGPQGAQAMADAIKVNNTLTELNLSHNNVGEAGAKKMVKALQVNKSIERIHMQLDCIPVASFRDGKTTKIDLSAMKYNDGDAIVIASLLTVNSTLAILSIGGDIGPQGAHAIVDAIKVNSTIESVRFGGDDFVPVASLRDGKTQEIDLRGKAYNNVASATAIGFFLTVNKVVKKVSFGRVLEGSVMEQQIVTFLKASPVLTELEGLDLASTFKSSVPEIAGLPYPNNEAILDLLRARKAQLVQAMSEAGAKHTEWYSDLEKRVDAVKAERVAALKPDLESKVRVICSRKFLSTRGWFEEESLVAMFEGHENWKDPLLADFSTALVSLADLLKCAQRVCISSYRWQDCKSSRTAKGKEVLLPANYGWFLQELGDEYAGWIDFVSHRQEPSELPAVLRLMPYLYALFPVLPQYLVPAHNSLEAIAVAFSRGWIFQESALVTLAPKVLQQFLHKLMATIASGIETLALWVKKPPRYGNLLVEGATQEVIPPDEVVEAVRMLLEVAKRRQRVEEVVHAVTNWCLSVADSKAAMDALFLQDIPRGKLTVLGLKSATDLQDLTQLLTLMLMYCMKMGSSFAPGELTAPYGTPALERALMLELALPAPADIGKLSTAQGIIAGFSETEFTQDEDEVVGTLSLVALLTGQGSVPISESKQGPLDGPVPKSQVLFANRVLKRCWETVINAGVPFVVNAKRAHAGLRSCGLGYVPRAQGLKSKFGKMQAREEKDPWHIQLVGTEVSANFEITYRGGRVSQVCVHPDKMVVAHKHNVASAALRSSKDRYLPLVPGLADPSETLSEEAAKKVCQRGP